MFRLLGVVETRHTVAGNAAQVVTVEVVLAAQPLVPVELLRQMNLVATAAEFRGLVQRLEESLLVKLRLGLDQLPVDPSQGRVVAAGERVVDRLLDGVVGVAAPAVEVGDGVAGGAGDPRLP